MPHDLPAKLSSPASPDDPTLQHVRIISRDFPWHIDVDTQRREGITCQKLLRAVHQSLQASLTGAEWEFADDRRKEKIRRAWTRRMMAAHMRGLDPASVDQRVKRVDWLGSRYLFWGLQNDPEFVEHSWRPGSGHVEHTWVIQFVAFPYISEPYL